MKCALRVQSLNLIQHNNNPNVFKTYQLDELTVAFTLGYVAGIHADGAKKREVVERGLKDGYEDQLDALFENMVTNSECAIPGLVVVAKRGDTVYHKAFGSADANATKPMTVNAQMRFVMQNSHTQAHV